MQIILIILGIVLIVYSCSCIKKENKEEKKVAFGETLKESKDDLNEYKIELVRLRKDIAESLTELQEEIIAIKSNLNMTTENINMDENKIDDISSPNFEENMEIQRDDKDYISENEFLINSNIDDGVISEIDFSNNMGNIEISKVEGIKKLLDEGLTEDEICHALSVSKGEILLVQELFKK